MTSGADPAATDNTPVSNLELERAYLRDLEGKPTGQRLWGYVKLSGPGWLQSALTLGGGSLASGLYLGVIGGTSLLWVQPVAMILGIIMLCAIGYVTLSTGERPFRAICHHINPVLGWGWLLASLAANMVWCLPQYSLATGVLQQNLFPGLLGDDGPLSPVGSKLVIVFCVFIITTVITWSYGSGHWGVRLYELLLKILVAMIVACFIGVVVTLAVYSSEFSWGAVFAGFIPNLGLISKPSPELAAMLQSLSPPSQAYWTGQIVSAQRDIMISAAATAVGINMTFLLPYSMLSRGWGREHRGLQIFDLSTGMFIPYMLATSCVVIAAASSFHNQPHASVAELIDKAPSEWPKSYLSMMESRVYSEMGVTPSAIPEGEAEKVQAEVAQRLEAMPLEEKQLAAALMKRDAGNLSKSLEPLMGKFWADIVFGVGVLGMSLSTISLLMLISGFVVCEVLNIPSSGWPFRLGTLLATTGALGPFVWGDAKFWLAVPTSVFGMVLLPIAYITFVLMMNQPSLLGDQMPRGMKRLWINAALFIAAGIATATSIPTIYGKAGWVGIGGLGLFVLAMIVTHVMRKPVDSPPQSA
ncbi:Natural resistance-associated macrophage protein [Planctomycetes bacterium Pan216]|uniref:Natural resistance-associated macrophage protein n=1 Tax=Kolteria novifilia TaxID=2527975 RepID=A0A518B9C2_9BACT|nr:Natural resistance-associated macrophage protein [Planctomycetes bacterium Pan216]